MCFLGSDAKAASAGPSAMMSALASTAQGGVPLLSNKPKPYKNTRRWADDQHSDHSDGLVAPLFKLSSTTLINQVKPGKVSFTSVHVSVGFKPHKFC